jgi:thioredoxin 1
MVLCDGVLLASLPGVLPAAALDELVTRARELDMDEVRRNHLRSTGNEEETYERQ